MSKPLVTILIPCYNCAEWVGPAIQSALNQTWPQKEVIVIDDGSRDESWDVIKSFGSAIRAERQNNQGTLRTRNQLLSLSNGEWIQYLDADDELAADKIELQMRHRDSAEVLYGSMRLEWFEGKQLVRKSERLAEAGTDAWAKWFRWEYPNPSACLFRNDLLKQVNGWDPGYNLCEDYALLKNIMLAGARIEATPDAWSTYRQWSRNQLVNKYSAKLADDRFRLMLEVVKELKARRELTDERSRVFQIYGFQVIRNLYSMSPEDGVRALSELQRFLRPFALRADSSPFAYRVLYRLVGFVAAERVVRWRRLIA
ncbi:MAG TPA: glycosyltransferase family A protein [Verrucomicrobiae bacterium]|jgi:glycosyltransferase involved in cell wall biosynthesis|nr:glycosyltransferase family A protein [Verrucomicrobiae bacterium]